MLTLALRLRYVILIASLGAFLGSLLMFWEGGVEIRDALVHTFAQNSDRATVVTDVMEATDKFLFGLVLVIFSFAITFGFALDLPDDLRDALPEWMRVESVAELKHVFFEVILVYLAVDYVTDVAETESHMQWTALVMPASIFLLAGAMRLLVGSKAESRPGSR